MRIGVHKLLMSSPNDVSGLERMIDAGTIDPREIVALIGKTEGNGGANDFTRGFATLSLSLALARRLGSSAEDVAKRVAFVWSGGTEGVLSPHATVFTRSAAQPSGAGGKRLALGIAVTRDFAPEEVGTMAEVREVAAATKKAQAEAGITGAKDVHYVQVKGPLLTPAAVADADSRGAKLVTRDPNGSKPYARGATALGRCPGAWGGGRSVAGRCCDSAAAGPVLDRGQHFGGRRVAQLRGPALRQLRRRQAATCASGTPCFATSSTPTGCVRPLRMPRAIPRRPSTPPKSSPSSPRRKRRPTACCAAGARRCYRMPTSTTSGTLARPSAP